MIRIDLLRRLRRRRRRVVAVLFGLVLLAGLAWLGPWDLAGRVGWMQPFQKGPATTAAPAEPALPAAPAPPVSPAPSAASRATGGAPTTAAAVDAPGSSVRPPAGSRLLRLGTRLPGAVRLEALACAADGGFGLEGSVTGAGLPELYGLLDSLRQLPSEPRLSCWRDGASRADQPFRFRLAGRLPSPATLPPAPQTQAQSAALFARAAAWARRGGPELLAAETLPAVPAVAGGQRQRQRLRFLGSTGQMGALVDSLSRVGDLLAVGEATLAEVFQRPPEPPRLQLTAVLETVVRP